MIGSTWAGRIVSIVAAGVVGVGGVIAISSGGPQQQASTSGLSCPVTTADAPGGPDPWGGCFPGVGNTGVPAGTSLTTVANGSGETAAQAVASGAPADNTGWTEVSGDITLQASNAVVDGISSADGVYMQLGNGGTVQNSSVGCVHDNSGTGALTVQDTRAQCGGWPASSVFADTAPYPKLTVLRVNGSGGQHGVLCYGTCVVKDSYFHDNATNNAAAHSNGFFTNGAQGVALIHNSFWCNPPQPVGDTLCTADVSLNNGTNNGTEINANEYRNLLVAIPAGSSASACMMPGPDETPAVFQVSGITVDGTVFQRGADGHCGVGAGNEVYGWFPGTCTPDPCVWSHNRYDDNATLSETTTAHTNLSVSGPASGTHGVAIPASSISASLTGGAAATGTITYRVYGPLPSAPYVCVGNDFSTPTSLGTAVVSGNATYQAGSGFTPAAAGNYWLYAIYGGDGSNDSAASVCPPMAEIVVS